MQYFVLMEQSGGCDYTIGCGVRFMPLRAMNLIDAQKEVEQLYEDYAEDHGIDSITIYEGRKVVSLDVYKLAKNLADRQRKEADLAALEEERAEYERLKAKFEGK